MAAAWLASGAGAAAALKRRESLGKQLGDRARSRGREAEQIKRWRRLIGEGSKKACYRVMGGGRSRSVHVGERAMGTALLLGYYNRNAVKPGGHGNALFVLAGQK